MHELAYPWRRAGSRGALWAISQRAALIALVRASRGVIVTAEFQARWLASRRWLPSRRTLTAPVFSNLPAPRAPSRPAEGESVIGVFGYAYQGASVALVLDALALLRGRLDVRLALLGAPGRSSPAGEQWLSAASARGVAELVSFAGPLPAQELSDALAGCDVLVMCDVGGPSSRKGTLAGSLASGTAVVALDGRHTWDELVRSEAAQVAPPGAEALASSLEELLVDPERRGALGARGRAFASQQMGLATTVQAVAALLDGVLGRRALGGA
jgi:glycosyltransferase involved in cell wall biosynthesis